METPEPRKNHVPFSPTKKHTAQYMCQEGKPLIAAELNVSISSISHNLRNLSHLQDFYVSENIYNMLPIKGAYLFMFVFLSFFTGSLRIYAPFNVKGKQCAHTLVC